MFPCSWLLWKLHSRLLLISPLTSFCRIPPFENHCSVKCRNNGGTGLCHVFCTVPACRILFFLICVHFTRFVLDSPPLLLLKFDSSVPAQPQAPASMLPSGSLFLLGSLKCMQLIEVPISAISPSHSSPPGLSYIILEDPSILQSQFLGCLGNAMRGRKYQNWNL